MGDRKRGNIVSKMQLVSMANAAGFVCHRGYSSFFLGGLLTRLCCLKEKQQIQQLQQIQL